MIAELYLDGKAFLDLGQLLNLIQGGVGGGISTGGAVSCSSDAEPSPAVASAPPQSQSLWPQLWAIQDPEIRALVQHMVQIDPGGDWDYGNRDAGSYR